MKKNNMKKGITLIEIILAIVLIAIILGITIPKLMSNSDRAEIKTVITSDVQSIVEAAMIWKKASADAQGNFVSLDGQDLNSRLPSNMIVAGGSNGDIYSSGLQTGKEDATTLERNTGAQYYITWVINKTGAARESGNFSIAMDISRGIADLNWDAKTAQYAKDVFNDTISELTNNEAATERVTSGSINTAPNTTAKAADWALPTGGTTVTCTAATGNVICYDNIKFQ